MRKILLTTVLAGAFWASASLPGWACSCAMGDDAGRYAHADAVFVGIVESAFNPRAGAWMQSSADPVEYEIRVESVQKGAVGKRVVVRSPRSSASCGFGFSPGRRYQVYATVGDAGLQTHLCSGTTLVGASVYEPEGSRTPPDGAAKGWIGPGFTEEPGRAKPLAGAVAGLLAAFVALGVVRALRFR